MIRLSVPRVWSRLFGAVVGAALAVPLTAVAAEATGGTGGAPNAPAPLLAAPDRPLAGRYVVVLKDDGSRAGTDAHAVAAGLSLRATRTYSHALEGFAAPLSAGQLDAVRRHPRVRYVAPDGEVRLAETQPDATWGLDRIDQRSLPLNGTYSYDATGAGVTAYVIDSGIRFSHVDFGGRARAGFSTVSDGRGAADCNGHGTHVAGTIGGRTHGVAKGVALVSVRVFGCTGGAPYSSVIAAVDWVTANRSGPSVANMSLSGTAYQPVDDAVRRSIGSGVSYVLAAGNSPADACSQSPARMPEAITVGATTRWDARAWFSNYGSCVDVFAPGQEIVSDWYTSDTAAATLDGTSMAAPHVTGAVALYLQRLPAATPAQAHTAVVAAATTGVVGSPGPGSPNRLLETTGLTPPPPPAAPETGGGATGDFNGDGLADMLTLYDYGSASAGLWVFPGTTSRGDGASLPYRAWFGVPGSFHVPSARVAAGDFTGDGRTDLLALYDYGRASAGLWVFPGSSGRGDAASRPYRVWYVGPTNFDVTLAKVSAGDFTGDGRADLLAMYDYGGGSTGLWVFPGTSAAGDAASPPYRVYHGEPGTFVTSTTRVTAGDFTGDGLADVMALYDYGSSSAGVWIFPGTASRGAGSSVPYRVWYGPPGDFSAAAATIAGGDFTGDGRADLLAMYDYGRASVGLWVFPGTSARGDAASRPYRVYFGEPGSFWMATTKITAGDFTGDGHADVIALYDYGPSSAGTWVFPGTASPGAGSSVPYRVWYGPPGSFAAPLAKVA